MALLPDRAHSGQEPVLPGKSEGLVFLCLERLTLQGIGNNLRSVMAAFISGDQVVVAEEFRR